MANSTPTPHIKKEKNESAGEQRAWAADVLVELGRDAGGVPFSQNLGGRQRLSSAEKYGIPVDSSGRTMEILY